jgi:hypothetical protein
MTLHTFVKKERKSLVILEKLTFRSFRGLQGTSVPASKTDEFVLLRNIN